MIVDPGPSSATDGLAIERFGLTALFIWFAENLATFSHAWLYPAQRHAWRLVAPEKLGSWLLLAIISFVLVTMVRPLQSTR